MKPKTRKTAMPKPRIVSRTRLAVSLFVFLAVLFQSYATQTHIHIPRAAGADLTLALASGKAQAGSQNSDHDKYPANEDPANCPLCQEAVHSGAFVAPAALAVWSPLAFVVLRWFAPPARHHLAPPSHDWRGRGPPSL